MIGWFLGRECLLDAVRCISPLLFPFYIAASSLLRLLCQVLFRTTLSGIRCIPCLLNDTNSYVAVAYPYLFAFEPSFVEIHSLETGALAQIIPGSNIRLLADGRGKLGEGGEILFACENSLPGAAGGMDGECQVNALIKTGADISLSPRVRHSEDTS